MKNRASRLIITFALAMSLLFAAAVPSDAATEADVGDNIVRVHLNSYGTPTSVTLNASGSYTIKNNSKVISGSFTVSANGAGIKITSGSTVYDLSGDVYIKAGSLAAGNNIQINGSYRYTGDMRILNKSGKLKLINHTDIDSYIMGVLPYEVSNSWPIETLKAHAVASRTYAYYVMHSKIRNTVEHDLVNSGAHQTYFGYNSANTNCINAVNATKNQILKTSSGQIVYACYSASNGGMTEMGIASGAASSNFAYLPLKDDPYDLKYALASTSYSGKVTVPKTMTAANLSGSSSQPYKMLRDKLKAAGIDTGSISGNVTVKNILLTNPRASSPDRMFTGANFILDIPGKGDVTLTFGPASVSGSNTKYPFLNDILGLGSKFAMLALRDDGSSWTIASVRYGHGAGLSQIGAYQMAAEGKSYKDILTFYYNAGSACTIVTMPWDTSGGTNPGSDGYTVTAVNKTGKVNTPGSTLNVRSGPATGYSILSNLKDGTKVVITGQVSDWWRIDLGGGKSGFASSAFITLDSGSTPPVNPPASETAAGKVNTPGSTLNMRSGAGTTYSIIASLSHGTKVTVSIPAAGGWYKLTHGGKTGYVSAAYITLDSQSPGTAPSQSKTVYVNTPGSTLNVRSGAGIGNAIIGSLKHGEQITVTDYNSEWYKLTFSGKTGYVSKAYTIANQPQTGGNTPQAKTVYVNTPGMTLNVRSGPGTSYSILGSLKHGEKLSVTDHDNNWYKLTYNGKTGYVSKSYTSSTAASSEPAQKTGTVNSATGLNVRSGPGTNNSIIGGLANGAKVTITGQSGSWYKIKYGSGEGWVSASYVKT